MCEVRFYDEVPGGHREPGETIEQAARRELYEETGALEYTLLPICVYSVRRTTAQAAEESYGMLYCAQIMELEPELHSEIESVYITDRLPDAWTYPDIQPLLLEEAERRGVFV